MNRVRRNSSTKSPLSSTALEVTITDLVAEYAVRHQFQNEGKEAIEAVFTFPIPLDAAFMGMQATLAGETVVAQVLSTQNATAEYDDAIAEGHSAVLLSNPEPGVLTISLGNLKPGESGQIELRFAAPIKVADKQARFSLPLVHRPRYGHWALDDLDTPEHDFAIEHPMSATIRVHGLLASAPVSCGSHAARFAKQGMSLELNIASAMLDRDLVLVFDVAADLAPVSRLIVDGEANLGMASFVLPLRQEAPKPLDLCLVLDSSGSMSGDAIEQSREATSAIIDALGEQDRVQVLRFGTSVVPMFRRPLLATTRVRDALRQLIPTINAELGGTEMGHALGQALSQLGAVSEGRSQAIILVTDGAVQPGDIEAARKRAQSANVRIFVVAVGSSAGTETLEPLAHATGAVLERAVPAEPIQAGVMRQFRRALESAAVALQVTWPSTGACPIPMGVVYPGDAVTVAACLPAGASGSLAIAAPTLGFALNLDLPPPTEATALRALLGQQRCRLARGSDREDLALAYGLLSKWTSAVLVRLRAAGDQAEGLPEILKIPQMVSDGMVDSYAGSASMAASSAMPPDLMQDMMGCDDLDETIAFSISPPPEIPQTPIRISVARAEELLAALYDCMRTALLVDRLETPTLAQIVMQLPAPLREHARQMLESWELNPDNASVTVQLFLALHACLGGIAMSDDEEAELCVAAAGPAIGHRSPDRKELGHLERLIAEAQRKGVHGILPGARSGFLRALTS